MKRMKTTITKTKYFLLALLVAFSFSCSPEDGDDGIDGQDGAIGLTGPAGLNGTNGVDGADGTNGTNGEDGEDGNANVITSDWFGPDGQTFISNGYTSYAEFNANAPEITSDIYNSGVVLVYAKFNNFVPEVWPTGTITPLPVTISGGTTDHIFTYYPELSNIKIRLRREGPEPTWTISSTALFRYIIIPSSTTKTSLDYSKMSYEEVMDILGLDY